MTKAETIKILTLLSAFYGEGKAEAEIMAAAWHELLYEYEYFIVRRAVMEYAKSDVREYASFPTPGRLIEAIEHESALYRLVFNKMLQGNDYSELPERGKALISESEYDSEKAEPYEDKLARKEEIIERLKAEDRRAWITAQKKTNERKHLT